MNNLIMPLSGKNYQIPDPYPVTKCQVSKHERSHVTMIPVLSPITLIKKPLILDILYSNLMLDPEIVSGDVTLTGKFYSNVEYVVIDDKCNDRTTYFTKNKLCAKRTLAYYNRESANAYALELSTEVAQRAHVKHNGEEGQDISCTVILNRVYIIGINTDGDEVIIYDSDTDKTNPLNLPFSTSLEYIPPTIDVRFTFRAFGYIDEPITQSEDDSWEYILLGFKINKHEKDSYKRVVYTEGATGMVPVYRERNEILLNSFSDVWFVYSNIATMRHLNDITMLDRDNYSLISNHNIASTVSNIEGDENAMTMIDKVWIKLWEDEDWIYCNLASDKVDSSYSDAAFINVYGESAPAFYISMFECSYINGKMRSLMGKAPSLGLTDEVIRMAINATGDRYEPLSFAKCQLITALLILMGKDTDIRKVFGHGNTSNARLTGECFKDGQFSYSNDINKSMKALHIENYVNAAYKMFADNPDEIQLLTDSDPTASANYSGVFMTC